MALLTIVFVTKQLYITKETREVYVNTEYVRIIIIRLSLMSKTRATVAGKNSLRRQERKKP